MTKTLPVSAIQHGTVIDHIAAGQSLRIIQLLRLMETRHTVTVGLHLPSKRMRFKDLIKIADRVLTNAEANDITIFAPNATISIIRDFEVADKMTTSLPAQIENVFICANTTCITHVEPVNTFFTIAAHGEQVYLTCRFCEKTVDRNHAKVKM